MMRSLLSFSILALAALSGPHALAETTATSLATAPSESKPLGALSLRADLQAATNSYRNDRKTESSYTLRPSYQWNEDFTSSAKVGFTKQHYELENFLMEDSSVSLKRTPVAITQSLTWAPAVVAIFPTNKKSRVEDSLQWGANLDNTFEFTTPGFAGLKWTYVLSLRYRAYEFLTSTTGVSNSPYRVSNLLSVAYQVNPTIDIDITFNPISSWTERTRAATTIFELSQEIGAQVSKNVRLTVGHSNLANAYKENGRDSNLSVYNAESSTFYGTLTLTL